MADSAPPSYEQATGSTSFARRERNGIAPEVRRSMEDESRPLPDGWVRSFDPQAKHQYFVDTKVDPPRAIWHHPFDDEDYMDSVSPEERQRIKRLARHPSHHDVAAETTDEEDDSHKHLHSDANHHGAASGSGATTSQPKRSLGRKMKDKLTGTTHDERASERRQREEMERDQLRQHQVFRQGLARAIETGQPQLLGEDDSGMEVYLEPPGSKFSGVQGVKRLSPYMQEVFYRPPGPLNKRARHLRPEPLYPGGYGPYARPYGAYSRPNGYGYGGGMGMMPLAGPLFGGMMLGGLAGGMLF